jgi:MHS family proline/betaine transporter-like MFS transporter
MEVSTPPTRPADASRTRPIVAGVIGHIVEWYDYSVYAYFAALIGTQFFPSKVPYASLLLSFAVFGVGFCTRPLGGIVFGHIGDRVGRRNALVTVVILMSVMTFLVGVLPPYSSAGLVGAVLLVIFRLLQGFSAGGEWAGSGAFLVEYAPPGRRGIVGCLQQGGIGIGLLLGSGFSTLLTVSMSSSALAAYGWRIAFLVAIVIGFAGLYLRLRVQETPHFTQVQEKGEVQRAPLVSAWRGGPLTLFKVFGFTISGTVAYYIYLTYFPSYASSVLHIPENEAHVANVIGILCYIASLLLTGWASDRIGRRAILLIHAWALVVVTYPLAYLLSANPTFGMLLLVQIVGAVLMGCFSGACVASYAEMFPTSVRYSGISVPYNVSVAIFGGFAAFIATALVAVTHISYSPAFYVIAAAIVSGIVYIVMRETYRDELA